LPPPSLPQDVYWNLPREERERREAAFRGMPQAWAREESRPDITTYEALQAPLYYWMMAPALWLARGWSLRSQVMLLRWLSALLASFVAPLAYWLARMVFEEEAPALSTAAVVAVMPGFALDVARVGNDSLAVVWFALLACLLLKPQGRGAQIGA